MEIKKSKLHGMTSDKAWRVKTRGNRKEDIFAELIKGIVLKGTKKPDVMSAYRQFSSSQVDQLGIMPYSYYRFL